jgi:16S rRNA (cytidine1402-2'-O)-methyltransferase
MTTSMTEQKRQNLPGGLWVVATPIGNLADLTPRARQALSEAHAILCEDTRRSAQLLSALTIGRPEGGLERVDAHATSGQIRKLVERLEKGENFALVTDAGTPGISDPGGPLVKAALEAGIRVTPVAGISAVAALLSVSGFGGTAFVFRGFFPRKRGERKKELELVRRSGAAGVWIWYESPNRIVEALEVFEGVSGRLIAGKELTKLHERLFAGEPAEVCRQVIEEVKREGEIGEWAFALELELESSELEEASEGAESSDWVKALECMLGARVPASDAARRVSHVFGAPRKIVYERALKISGKKE